MRTPLFLAATIVVAASASLGAQATVGGQGFGYPPGQASTRAQGTGSAVLEIDPLSPVNPASLAIVGSRILFFQIEPEFRTVRTATGTDRTTTARYPNVLGAMPVGERWVVSLGASTLLDRTATTTLKTTQIVGRDTLALTNTFRIDGALNDLRAAVSFAPSSWLRLGGGLHGFTGRNLISVTEAFEDTAHFSGFALQRNLSFSGAGLSGGAQLVSKTWQGAVSFRYGGTLHLSSVDTMLAEAKIPSRVGASLAYVGIAHSAIAVRTSHENWSAIGDLGQAGFHAHDAWDTSVGADMAGPQLGQRPLFLRAGYRVRGLPFPAAGKDVTEKSISAGLGTLFGDGRAAADLAVIRAMRDADVAASERAWTVSIGISVRP
jgi:hypothetical protein